MNGEPKPSVKEKIKNKLQQYKRTVDVAVKPDKEEFLSSAKITALGIVLVGIIGFIIYILYHLVVG